MKLFCFFLFSFFPLIILYYMKYIKGEILNKKNPNLRIKKKKKLKKIKKNKIS